MKPLPASLVALCLLGAVAWATIALNSGGAKTIPELYEVMRPSNEKTHAISTLSPALRSRDPDIRLTAAKLLLAFGDQSGVRALHRIAGNPRTHESLRIRSFAVLDQHGIRIEYAQLHALYEATQNPELVRIMAMQRHAEAAPFAQQHQQGKAGGSYYFLGLVVADGRYAKQVSEAFYADDGRERGEAGL